MVSLTHCIESVPKIKIDIKYLLIHLQIYEVQQFNPPFYNLVPNNPTPNHAQDSNSRKLL